jgi:hypothetical protein
MEPQNKTKSYRHNNGIGRAVYYKAHKKRKKTEKKITDRNVLPL